ncbi:MAG TPA: hypothetical protein VHT30_03990 [Acidimicrobiales bacterium]|nr:hypothetical protein [Acidimicrobiales bacterium]
MSDSDELPVVAKPTDMLRWEKQAGSVVAGVSAAGGLLVTFAGHDALAGLLAVAASGILLFGVRRGHRVIAALSGLPSLVLAKYLPVEIVLLAFVLFLMLRTSNAQSKLRRSMPRQTPAERRAAADAQAAERKAKRRGQAPAPAVKTPPKNRRYTPPKAKPKRPAPAPSDRRRSE